MAEHDMVEKERHVAEERKDVEVRGTEHEIQR